jgi:hypothetical protein
MDAVDWPVVFVLAGTVFAVGAGMMFVLAAVWW